MEIGIMVRLSCVLAGGDVTATTCLLLQSGAELTALGVAGRSVLPRNLVDVRNPSLVPPKSEMTFWMRSPKGTAHQRWSMQQKQVRRAP
jgi:hypothetical protein